MPKRSEKNDPPGNKFARGALSFQKRRRGTPVNDEVRERMIEFLPRLRRFACALTGNVDEGDDLVQETCARVLERIDQWRPGTALESWMFRIAQNLWKDQMRARKVRGETVDVGALPEIVGTDGREVMDGRLALAAVLRDLSRLPEDQRVLVALVCIEGLAYKEAAEMLDIPIGTVMSRLARARRALHQTMFDDEGGGREDGGVKEDQAGAGAPHRASGRS